MDDRIDNGYVLGPDGGGQFWTGDAVWNYIYWPTEVEHCTCDAEAKYPGRRVTEDRDYGRIHTVGFIHTREDGKRRTCHCNYDVATGKAMTLREYMEFYNALAKQADEDE